MREEKDLYEIVAYHEAGHAVMTLSCGKQLWEIAISSPWSGHMRSESIVHRALRDSYKAPPYRRLRCLREVLIYIKILLAGPAAECEFRGLPLRGPGSPWRGDHEVIHEILAIPRVRKAFERYVPGGRDALMDEVAEWVVQSHVWDSIRLVAEAVMTRHYMQWNELLEWFSVNQSHKSQLSLI